MAHVVNVMDYGATGDGTTDDTAAITSAIAALDASQAMLVFPPGVYLTSGGFTLANPVKVVGAGRGNKSVSTGLSVIKCNHASNSLFTVNGLVAWFSGLDMVCTNETPTAGAAVTVTNAVSSARQQVDFSHCSARGFYNNIVIGVGNFWTMDSCFWGYAVKNAVKIDNTVNADAGDWAISNCVIDCGDTTFATAMEAGIKIEGSGGGKIINTKVNGTGEKITNGIDLAMANEITVILLIDNCSIENVAGNGINIAHTGTGTFKGVSIRGCQFGFWNGAHGAMPINITADAAGGIAGVTIIGNIVVLAPNAAFINLTNVDKVFIDGNINLGATDLLAETTCTNVSIGAVVA